MGILCPLSQHFPCELRKASVAPMGMWPAMDPNCTGVTGDMLLQTAVRICLLYCLKAPHICSEDARSPSCPVQRGPGWN